MLALAYLRVCALLPQGSESEELGWVISGLDDCEGLDESKSDQLRLSNRLLTLDVEQHDAFEIRFLDGIAQHGYKPDFSVVHIEVKNKLPVVNSSQPLRNQH